MTIERALAEIKKFWKGDEPFPFGLSDNTHHLDRLKTEFAVTIPDIVEDYVKKYQGETIGKFDLGFDGKHFILKNKQTACLASDACGIPAEKQKVKLSELNSTCCTPDSGCC